MNRRTNVQSTATQTGYNPVLQKINFPGGAYNQMKGTVAIVGDAIVDASRYLPIRNRAAALATQAAPKDYLGQVKAVFNDFTTRWRYVKDIFGRELVHRSPKSVYELTMGGDANRPAVLGKGFGDCDDATVAMGAQLASIGFPVRIATIASLGMPPGRLMSHVFCQAKVPGIGWITVDPVVFPKHGLGYTPPASRLVTWDLSGKLLSQKGNARGLSGTMGMEDTMETNLDRWQDYAGMGDYSDPSELLDFRQYGIKDFGIYADTMGMLGGCGLLAEVEIDEFGRAWTPALELRPEDYRYMGLNGVPYNGMPALGDNGSVYMYDANLGFFKSIFSAAKGAVSKVVGKAKDLGRKLISKIPGGKYLMKLGDKVWSLSKKLLNPLMQLVGPLAKRVAPVSALIPGYGPAIAAALYTTGKVADLMKQYDVLSVKKKGGPNKLKFKSGAKAKGFQKKLKKLAKKQKRKEKAKRKAKRAAIAQGVPPQSVKGMGFIPPRRRMKRQRRIAAGLPVRRRPFAPFAQRFARRRPFAPFYRGRQGFRGHDEPQIYN